MTLKCQQLSRLLFCLFFLVFLQQVWGCDQYSGRQSLTLCQNLRSRASCFSFPLSEAEFMADCPLSVTSGTVWLIWPVVLMCSGMRNAYCLPLARLLESARENVQENRDIHPSLPFSPSLCVFFPSCSSALPHFRAELQGCHGGQLRSRLGYSHGRWRNKSPVSEVLKAV